MEASRRRLHPCRPRRPRNRGRRDRPGGDGRRPRLLWPPIPELLALDIEDGRAGALSRPLEGAGEERAARSRAACPGGGDRRRRARPRRAARGGAGADRAAQPGAQRGGRDLPERSREMLAAAPGGPLHGVPVVIKDEWPLPWRAQRFGAAEMMAPTAPASRPLRALRDAGAMIVGVGNMHELGAGSTGASPVTAPRATPGTPSAARAAPPAGPRPRRRPPGRRRGRRRRDRLGAPPAAYCGLTGLKPTFGRSAMEGHHMASISSMIVSGPLCADAGRLPPARLGALRRGARPPESRGPADRRRPRHRLRGRGAGGERRPARRRSRRCAPRPAASCARSSSPTSSRRRWRRS